MLRLLLTSRSGHQIGLFLDDHTPRTPDELETAGARSSCEAAQALIRSVRGDSPLCEAELRYLWENDRICRYWFSVDDITQSADLQVRPHTIHPPATESVSLPQLVNAPIGQRLVTAGVLEPHQVDLALRLQPTLNCRLGEVLQLQGRLSSTTLEFFLNLPSQLNRQFLDLRLGERLQQVGLVTGSELDRALQCQRWLPRVVGRILSFNEVISPRTADYFASLPVLA